jgi:hypothetical protein
MSENLKLGQIITGEQYRDAIHIAVAPVEALEDLLPGQHVGVTGKENPVAARQSPHVGIVDPFLRAAVKRGQKFWLYLYPGSITSLRHEWTHPSIAPEATKPAEPTVSDLWMSQFADRVGTSVEDVIQHAKDYIQYGDYWCEGGRFEGESVPDEFWDHFENITGRVVRERERGSFFSCSC